MKAQDLPIYRATYQLLEKVANYSKHFHRSYKLSLAPRLQTECTEMVMDVYRANAARQGRREIVERILERVRVVELMLRLCRDLRQISIKQHANVIEMTEAIGRQAYGWAQSATRSTGQNARRHGGAQ